MVILTTLHFSTSYYSRKFVIGIPLGAGGRGVVGVLVSEMSRYLNESHRKHNMELMTANLDWVTPDKTFMINQTHGPTFGTTPTTELTTPTTELTSPI